MDRITNNGIKWGVDTCFVTRYSSTVYNITEIKDDRVTLSWTDAIGTIVTSIRTVEACNNNFSQGLWTIQEPELMSIKSVDPKSIKFDFADTKIVLANSAESNFVQQVALANGFRWQSGERDNPKYVTSKCLYFDSSKSISQTTMKGIHFDASSKREITMKQILAQSKNTGVVASTEETVGYVLLKSVPGIPSGTQSTEKNNVGYRFVNGDISNTFSTKQLEDKTWFLPITKPKEVRIAISDNRTVVVTNRYVQLAEEKIAHNGMKEIYEMFTSTKTLSRLNGSRAFSVSVNTIRVGCQMVTREDVIKIYNAVSQFNKDK